MNNPALSHRLDCGLPFQRLKPRCKNGAKKSAVDLAA
jgi:hypothetical protein